MPIKKIAQYISVGALFLIPVFPLIVANSFFFPFITGKAFYFRILVELAFAAWVVLAFADARYRPKFNWLTVSVTAFTVIVLIADLLGVNAIRSLVSNFERMEGWLVIIHLWAFFIVASNVFGHGERGRKMWHYWFIVSLAVATVVAIYGILQLLGQAEIHQGSSRIDASLGNAAYMAVYMLINAFISAYMFFASRAATIKENYMQWVYAFLALLFAFLVFETATRGTILGLIGGTILALALFAVFGKGERKQWRYVSLGILGVIVLSGVVFWMNRDAKFIQENTVLSRMANISWKETQSQARAYVWPMAINGGLERPILGWGQENFNYIFNENYEPRMWSQEQWFDRAHSVYLDWFVASGFLGLIAYLSLYVLFLVAIWRSKFNLAEKSTLTGLLAAYAIHNIFVFDNLASYVLFFGMLGFAASVRESREISWMGNKPLRLDAVEYIVAPAVVVLLVLGIYFINARPINANTHLIKALGACQRSPENAANFFKKALAVNSRIGNQEIREQILSCSGSLINAEVPVNVKQDLFSLSVEQIQAQINETPKDARIYTLGGAFYNSIGQFAEAGKLLDVAHQLSPRKQSIIFQLATDYINNGKNEQAVELLKNAYESDPTYFDAKSAYVLGLIILGKEEEAKKQFGDDPALFQNERVAQVYLSQEKTSKAIAIYEKLLTEDPSSIEIADRLAQVYVGMESYSKAIAIYEKLLVQNPGDINIKVQLARAQYAAGMVTKSIQTMRSIVKDRPDLEEQIEQAIKEIQK